MIPEIETIAEDLAAGRISVAQAIAWLHQRAGGSENELRDHFAGLAMQANVTAMSTLTVESDDPTPMTWHNEVARLSYMTANAMLIERVKRGPTSADGVAALADAFERSADWLDKGVLHGSKRTHPLVGTADYRKASALLRSMIKEGKP